MLSVQLIDPSVFKVNAWEQELRKNQRGKVNMLVDWKHRVGSNAKRYTRTHDFLSFLFLLANKLQFLGKDIANIIETCKRWNKEKKISILGSFLYITPHTYFIHQHFLVLNHQNMCYISSLLYFSWISPNSSLQHFCFHYLHSLPAGLLFFSSATMPATLSFSTQLPNSFLK